MDPSSRWLLLRNVTNILYDVAELLKGNSEYAKAAQRKVHRADRFVADPFHASMSARLGALASLLTEDYEDLDFASGLIENEVNILLDTFNILVLDTLGSDTKRTATASFSGLEYLIEMHEKELIEARNPRPPGHRLCLYCPSKKNRDRLRRDTVSCERALMKTQRKTRDLPSILDKIDSCKELPLPSSISRNAQRTGNIVLQYWDCNCFANPKDSKQAVIGFAGSSGIEKQVASRYILNFKTCLQPEWCTTSLALTVKVDQNEPMQLQPQPPKDKSKNTRFSDSEQSRVTYPAQSNWRFCNNFCDTFHSSEKPGYIYINETELKSSTDPSSPSAVPSSMLSLHESFTTDSSCPMSKLRGRDRIVLAVILAYMYLHLSETPWWLAHDITPYCWFPTSPQLAAFNPRLPFFDLMQDMTLEGESSDIVPSFEASMNPQRPSLPALGKLLLEIWKGTRISWDEVQSCMKDCIEDCTGAYWSCAIKACIWDPTLKLEGSLRKKGLLQTNYVHKVIKSLQWLMEETCGISVRDAFSEMLREPVLRRANTTYTRSKRLDGEASFPPTMSNDTTAHGLRSKKHLRLSDYTVGWISPMLVEYTAARQLLDEEHKRLPTAPDTNRYIFGEVRNSFGQTHNVVIGTMSGYTGVVRASEVAQAMRRTFTNLRVGLLVGIGGAGGRPEESDIRLGDIVIAQPRDQHGGFIQYDFIKDTQYLNGKAKGAKLKNFLLPPPQAWLDAMTAMQNDHELRSNLVPQYLKTIQDRPGLPQAFCSKFQRPTDDLLFDANYIHPEGNENCEACDKSYAIAARSRKARLFPGGANIPKIHYGIIATGGRVEKNAKERDRISDWLGGVKAFEMEAAGVMSATSGFQYAVIRGVSDYSDSHKNDIWHDYAAAAAAAVAKEVLTYMEVYPAPETW